MAADCQLRIFYLNLKLLRHVINRQRRRLRRVADGHCNRAAPFSHRGNLAVLIHNGDRLIGRRICGAIHGHVNTDLCRLAHVKIVPIQLYHKAIRIKRRGHKRVAGRLLVINRHMEHRARRRLLTHHSHRGFARRDGSHHARLVDADHTGGLNSISHRTRHAIREHRLDGRSFSHKHLHFVNGKAHGCGLRLFAVLCDRILRRIAGRLRVVITEEQFLLVVVIFFIFRRVHGVFNGCVGFILVRKLGFGGILSACHRQNRRLRKRIFCIILIAERFRNAVLKRVNLVLRHRAQCGRIHPALLDGAFAVKCHAQTILGANDALRHQHDVILLQHCGHSRIRVALDKERRVRKQPCIAEFEFRRS